MCHFIMKGVCLVHRAGHLRAHLNIRELGDGPTMSLELCELCHINWSIPAWPTCLYLFYISSDVISNDLYCTKILDAGRHKEFCHSHGESLSRRGVEEAREGLRESDLVTDP